jgi:hypothetical protein
MTIDHRGFSDRGLFNKSQGEIGSEVRPKGGGGEVCDFARDSGFSTAWAPFSATAQLRNCATRQRAQGGVTAGQLHY